MSDAVLSRTGNFLGVGAALALLAGIGVAAPAQARGLVADEDSPTIIAACDLASLCTAPGAFATTPFSDVYVYSDGAISIGSALVNPVQGDLSTFGNSYIAAGLADYAGLGLNMSVQYKLLPDNFSGPELELYWIFTSNDTSGVPPDNEQALFGIYLTSLGGGNFEADVASGLGGFTWFNTSTTPQNSSTAYKPYCDLLCQSQDPSDTNVIYGVYLPDGALLGSSFSGTEYTTDADGGNASLSSPYDGSPVTVDANYAYPNYVLKFTHDTQTTTPVPEPATWPTVLAGLAAVGLLRRRIRRRPAAAVGT